MARGFKLTFRGESKRSMNIYIGNLSYSVTEEDLRQAFQAFGTVESVKIITDNFSGRSKGFGFVEMPETEEAEAAIAGLNGKEMKGRTVTVNQAKPRTESRPRTGKGREGSRRQY